MRQLPVRYYAYGVIGVANHSSDWSAPNFQEDPIHSTGSYCSQRQSGFLAMFVVVSICTAIAILFKLPTSKQSYYCSIDQKTSVHTQKSSTGPGKFYKNAFLSHQVRCCIGDSCVQSASFVICRMMDTRSVISLSRLVGADTSDPIDHIAM